VVDADGTAQAVGPDVTQTPRGPLSHTGRSDRVCRAEKQPPGELFFGLSR